MKKKTITLNDFSGGITQDTVKTLSSVGTTAKSIFPNKLGEYNEGTQINLYRGGYLGHLSSMPSTTVYQVDSGGTYNLPFCGLYDTRTSYNDDKMFILVNDKIVYLDLQTGTPTNLVTGLIGNTVGSLLNYVDTSGSTGAQTIFAYLENGFRTFNAVNTAFTGTTPSTFSLAGTYNSTGAPIKTILGPNKQMYFTNFVSNQPVIGRYDPSGAGTFSSNYSVVETGYYIQDICAYGSYVAIIANNYKQYGSKPKLYIWDGQTASTYISIHEIDDHIALSLHEEDGSLFITTIGEGLFKIKKFSGSAIYDTTDFIMDASLIEPMTATAVQNGTFYNALNYNRIKNVRGMWFIQGFDGKVWYKGKPVNNAKFRDGFHCIFNPNLPLFTSGDTYYSAGFLEKNPRRNEIIVGYRDSVDFTAKVCILDLDSINSSVLSAPLDEYSYWTSNILEVPANSTITNITVDFSDFSDARTGFTIGLYKDYDNTTDYLTGFTKASVNFTTNGQIYRYPINVTVNKVDMFYLKLRFASCSIKSISIEYTYDNLSAEG